MKLSQAFSSDGLLKSVVDEASNHSSQAQHCPLCGQPNQCAMEAERVTGIKQPPCWCTQVSFTPSLLEQIPESKRGTACVCAACAAKADRI